MSARWLACPADERVRRKSAEDICLAAGVNHPMGLGDYSTWASPRRSCGLAPWLSDADYRRRDSSFGVAVEDVRQADRVGRALNRLPLDHVHATL